MADNRSALRVNRGPSLIVVGNGPSLRDVDPERFAGIDTIGMNAAYRAWERHDWWPTYYACADHRLALSHIDFFRDAAASRRFRRMLLPATVLHDAPELAHDPDVEFIDQYLPYWYEQLGAPAGLARRQSPFFESTRPSLVTTGAVSIRWGASLGYARIGLIGIDCRYVALPAWQTESDTDLSLRMAETPEDNPNYFFADYQREGDLFNVPQPGEHGSNLHLAAIATVRDDFRIQHMPVTLTNLSEGSELSRQGALPYQRLDAFLGASGIGLVTLDHRARWTLDRARAQLAAMGNPDLLPTATPQDHDAPGLLMLVPDEAEAGEIATLDRYFSGHFHLPYLFDGLRIVRCDPDLPRDEILERYAADRAGFGLTLDARALPLRFGWLEVLTELCRTHGGAGAIGSATLVNLRMPDGEAIDTAAIVDIGRHTAETLDDVRADFPAAVLALNALWIRAEEPEIEADTWHRDCDRLNIVEPPAGPTAADPWFLGAGLFARVAIGLAPMGGAFRPGDEIDVEVHYAAVGGWLAIEVQAADTSSTLGKSEPFEAQGVGHHSFRIALPSLSQALRIRVALAEPALPDGFDPIVRLDRIAVSLLRGDMQIGRARLERLREKSDFDNLDAAAIIEHFGQSRAFLANGESSFRHEIALSIGYGETARCSARYGEGNLIVALGGRMAVIENPDPESEAGIIRVVSEFARTSAAAQD
ncbi:hypothetical protein [Sphingomonas sp. MMS24-J13]|uniref:hypothetical protein n=1 Tax=Sphingomonas sp. MMS24-J13 TaxID=3238686 RepID=UPI00384D87BC